MVNNGGNIAKLADKLSDNIGYKQEIFLRIHIIGGNYTCHKGSKLSSD